MASLNTLERRIAALEARLADIEGGYGDTLYMLHRHAVGTNLTLGRIAQQLGVTPATDDEIGPRTGVVTPRAALPSGQHRAQRQRSSTLLNTARNDPE